MRPDRSYGPIQGTGAQEMQEIFWQLICWCGIDYCLRIRKAYFVFFALDRSSFHWMFCGFEHSNLFCELISKLIGKLQEAVFFTTISYKFMHRDIQIFG